MASTTKTPGSAPGVADNGAPEDSAAVPDGLAAEMAGLISGSGGAAGAQGGGPAPGSMGGVLGALNMKKVYDGTTIAPEGTWVDVEVAKSAPKVAASGNNMIALQLVVVGPQDEYCGIRMYDNLVIADSSMWKVKSAMKACGLLSADGASFLGNSEQDFVKKVMRCQLTIEVYEGTPRNKVKGGYRAPDGEYSAPGSMVPSGMPDVSGGDAAKF